MPGTTTRKAVPFQSQRRFFGGSNQPITILWFLPANVSIAEAILWGEQHPDDYMVVWVETVSIAEAILWGEQL